jgi:ribosomal protein S4
MSTVAYMWFFEFNLAVFLVKINFSESIKHAHALITKQLCVVNSDYVNARWVIVKPGDIIQLPLSGLLSL